MFYSVFVDNSFLKPETSAQTRNPKGVIMSRTFSNFSRFIGNYRHYRRKGLDYRTAWYLAGLTLP